MAKAGAIRAGAAYVEAFLDDNRLRRGLSATSKRLKAWGATVGVIGAGLTAFGSTVLAPALAAVSQFASEGSKLSDMAVRTGMSAETLSELGWAADQSGTSLDALGSAVFRMRRRIANASTEGGPAVRALKEIGLAADELTQLPVEEQFMAVVAALGQAPNESRRAQMAFEILGDGAKGLMPLLAQGTEGIEALRNEARALGLTLSTRDAAAASEYGNALARLTRMTKQTTLVIGAAVAPTLTDLMGRVVSITAATVHWINEHRELFLWAVKIAAGISAIGFGLIFLGGVLATAGVALGGMVTLLNVASIIVGALAAGLAFLVSPIGLVITGLAALAGWFFTATEAGSAAIDWLIGKFTELRDWTLSVFGGIADALAAGNIQLAAEILWLALQVIWQKGIGLLKTQWAEWKIFFLSLWQDAVFGLASILANGWAAIQTGWVEGTDFLLDLWDSTINSMLQLWTGAQNTLGSLFIDALGGIGILSDEEAELAKQLLAEDTGGRANRSQAATDQAIAEREQARKERLAAIEAERAGTQESLAQMHAAELAAIQSEQGQAAAEAKLQKARNALAAATRQAKAERGAAADSGGQAESFAERFKKIMSGEGLAGALESAAGSSGTFSAMAAVRQFGASSAADRTAKATEETARNTRKLAKEAGRGLAFS